MSLMMMLALGGRLNTITETYTANTAWVAPAGVTRIDTLLGKGGEGYPAEPGQTGWQETAITTLSRRDGGTEQVSSTGEPVFDGSAKPANYCDPTVATPDSTAYSSYTTCYGYFTVTSPGSPAVTGAATTGFSKTFPGGTGGPATPASYANVAVTPGTSYPLVIPAGGAITITYQK